MSGNLLDMESPVEDDEGRIIKHADSDSVNSIPPPPPPLGMSAVPVASEESCDITEAERLRQADEEEGTDLRRNETGPNQAEEDRLAAERHHRELEAQQMQQQHLYAEPRQLKQQYQEEQKNLYQNQHEPEEEQNFQPHDQESEPLHPQQHQQQQKYEDVVAISSDQQNESQQEPLVSVEATTVTKQKETSEGQGDGCCDNFLRCLSLVPCPSLLSWILLLCGLGCLTGSLLFGTWHTRDLLEDDSLLWFMEYTVIGVMSGMFVFGCLVLTASHLSTEPTSRRVFNSFTKNKCAQGMNIFALIVSFMLAMCWVLVTAIFAAPVLSIIALLIVNPDSLDLGDFGFNGGVKTGPELDTFKKDCRELLISWGVVFVSSVMIVKSLICFIICVTANITHLRDNRFSTLNAYGSEEVRNSKHSVLDTNM